MDYCCHKTKHRSDEEQKKLTPSPQPHRGQVRGLREMLQKDAYCPDILIQVSAVSAALNSFQQGAAGHPHPHLRGRWHPSGDDAVIDELVTTLQKAHEVRGVPMMTEQFAVTGMTCAACSAHVERRSQAQRRAERPGEPDAGQLTVTYDEGGHRRRYHRHRKGGGLRSLPRLSDGSRASCAGIRTPPSAAGRSTSSGRWYFWCRCST